MLLHQEVCDTLGISRGELAEKLGVSKGTVNRFIRREKLHNYKENNLSIVDSDK